MDYRISIAIVEPFELERIGIIAVLKQYAAFEIKLSVSNGHDLIEGFRTCKPDVVLLAVHTTILDGRKTFNHIKNSFPEIKVIILMHDFTDANVIEFMNNGACAFLSKNSKIEKLVDTIKRVQIFGICYDTIVANILARINDLKGEGIQIRKDKKTDLTYREIQILRLMCTGLENKKISESLHIKVRTIESHRRNIWHKTKCENIVELIEFSFKHNLICVK